MGRIKWGGYEWRVFSGTGRLGQKWKAENVVQQPDGALALLVKPDGSSGGVGMYAPDQKFGKWSVQWRMTKGSGKYCICLFPNTNRPEIDFAEGQKFDTQRKYMTATLHPDPGNLNQIHSKILGDYTQVHTAAVDYRSDHLAFLLDGKEWFRITNKVPQVPMGLKIQTASFKPGAASRLVIEKVTIEK